MEVTYELKPDDLWHYYLYYLRHHAPFQSLLLNSIVGKIGFGLLCAVFLGDAFIFMNALLKHQSPDWSMLFGIGAMVFVIPRLLPTSKKRLVKKMSRQPGFFCQHIISIDPDWFFEQTPVNETKLTWQTLHSIEEDADYQFYFMSKNSAYIIPKRAFGTLAEAQAFLALAHRYGEAAKTGQPTLADDAANWPPPPQSTK